MKRIRAFRLGGLGEIRQIETLLNRDDAARMGVFATSFRLARRFDDKRDPAKAARLARSRGSGGF